MIFLGCDAGSTKTEFLLASTQGGLLCRRQFPACNYLEAGHDRFSVTMTGWIVQVLDEAGLTPEELTYAVYGLPTLGEIEGLESGAAQALGRYAAQGRSLLCNDSVLGWAGSLAGEPGINVVSGTGSIVYGEDAHGHSRRVGGWSLLFDDPGSSAWVARQALALFFRQVDGRAERSPLYAVFCDHWQLGEHPEYFAGKALRTLNTDRSELAKTQLLARLAVDRGDEAVAEIYREAVRLLAESASTVWRALDFPSQTPVPVSYSGGFFRNGPLVLEPFRIALQGMGMALRPPRFSPAVGALALGARRFLAPEELTAFLNTVQEVIHARGEPLPLSTENIR